MRLNKWQLGILVSTVFLFTNIHSVFADTTQTQPEDKLPFVNPPYSYTYFDGGNCVWLAWEMAYENWGIQLPWAGDAHLWTDLGGQTVEKKGWDYNLRLSDTPKKNSIAIFQKSDLDAVAGHPFNGDHYGHVAWVTTVRPFTVTTQENGHASVANPTMIDVLESTIYPPSSYGYHWHGCWWDTDTYNTSNLKTLKFLYISKEENETTHTSVEGGLVTPSDDPTVYSLTGFDSNPIEVFFPTNQLIYLQDASNPLQFEKEDLLTSTPLSLNSNKTWTIVENNGIDYVTYQSITSDKVTQAGIATSQTQSSPTSNKASTMKTLRFAPLTLMSDVRKYPGLFQALAKIRSYHGDVSESSNLIINGLYDDNIELSGTINMNSKDANLKGSEMIDSPLNASLSDNMDGSRQVTFHNGKIVTPKSAVHNPTLSTSFLFLNADTIDSLISYGQVQKLKNEYKIKVTNPSALQSILPTEIWNAAPTMIDHPVSTDLHVYMKNGSISSVKLDVTSDFQTATEKKHNIPDSNLDVEYQTILGN